MTTCVPSLQCINKFSHIGEIYLVSPYGSGAQTYWLMGHICLSETLRAPQELIISIKILLNDWSVKFSFQLKLLRRPLFGHHCPMAWFVLFHLCSCLSIVSWTNMGCSLAFCYVASIQYL